MRSDGGTEEENHDTGELSKRYGYSVNVLMSPATRFVLTTLPFPSIFKNYMQKLGEHLNLTCEVKFLFCGRAKRMSLEIGPSSFASRKKKKKTSAT